MGESGSNLGGVGSRAAREVLLPIRATGDGVADPGAPDIVIRLLGKSPLGEKPKPTRSGRIGELAVAASGAELGGTVDCVRSRYSTDRTTRVDDLSTLRVEPCMVKGCEVVLRLDENDKVVGGNMPDCLERPNPAA